jgi:hypothetical protein
MSFLDDNRTDDQIIYENLVKVPTAVREVVDEESAERRRLRYAKRLEQERRQQEAYGKEFLAAKAMEERRQNIAFENATQGRHKGLKPKQVLFTKEQECELCSKPCCYVLPGWNGNASMMGFRDLTTPYDPSYTDDNKNHSRKHECSSDNPAEMFKILDRKINALNTKIELSEQRTFENIRSYSIRPGR